MPTDGARTAPDVPGVQENLRQGLRLALAPSAVFCFGMVFELPLAFVGAVFTVIFSIGLKPVPVKTAVLLLGKSVAIMLLAFCLSSILVQYPAVFLISVCVGVLLAYDLQLRTGDLLLSVFAVIAALLVPLLTLNSPGLVDTIAFWLMANLFVAIIASWTAFWVFPEMETSPADAPAPTIKDWTYDRPRRLLRLACVIIPFVIGAFVYGLITPFVIVFAAIQSSQFVANTGSQRDVSENMLAANAIGGLVAVVVYEMMVVATFLPFAVFIIVSSMLWFSQRLILGDARIMSAITAFLILVGGTLMPFSDDAQTKMISRLWQLGLAFGYLSLAFLVVDKFFPEKEVPDE